MTTESIFGQEPTSQPDVPKPAEFTIPTEVTEFVGQGKKYSSVEDALKSVPHAQTHIQKLEDELKQMRMELEKRKTTEELLDEIKGQTMTRDEKPSSVQFDQGKLEEVVQHTLAQREAQQKAQSNASTVVSAFKEKFGDAAEATFVQIAQESGLGVDALNKLAATSPKAVFKLAGIDSKGQSMPSHVASSVNTEALKGGQVPQVPSSKVKPVGASTKELVSAWKAAGEAVKKELGIS